MQYSITVRFASGNGGSRSVADLRAAQNQLGEMAQYLDQLQPGEVIEVKRLYAISAADHVFTLDGMGTGGCMFCFQPFAEHEPATPERLEDVGLVHPIWS